LRALVKYLDNVSEKEIVDLNIPTGIPLVYELDENLKPIKSYYLGDPEEAKKKAHVFAPYSDGKVCARCQGVGYKGRIGIMEVMKVEDEIRKIINFENGNEDKIQQQAIKNGMLSIQQYGYLLVMNGITTFEEVNNAVLSA